VLTTGDVAHALGCSIRWVSDLAHEGKIRPRHFWRQYRHGRWEPHLLFTEDEVARYQRSLSRRVEQRRNPRQLRLQLFGSIKGGRP
jgi:hypothetical protein